MCSLYGKVFIIILFFQFSQGFNIDKVEAWTTEISRRLLLHEKMVTDQERLKKSFTHETRGRKIEDLLNEVTDIMSKMLASRERAVANIAKRAEQLADERVNGKKRMSSNYKFFHSFALDQKKPLIDRRGDALPRSLNSSCTSKTAVDDLVPGPHFKHRAVSLSRSSVHVAVEVYECADKVITEIQESEGLDVVYRMNYEEDASLSWQYYCSARGFIRHYPMALWEQMQCPDFSEEEDIFDCRIRDWYVESAGQSRNLVILLDATGSMTGERVEYAYRVLETLFLALAPEDHVNVFRFSDRLSAVVPCFGDNLVPAIPANTRILLQNLNTFPPKNISRLDLGLERAVQILKNQHRIAPARQQGIVILADDMPENWNDLMSELNKDLRARVFIFLFGLIDQVTTVHAERMACEHDGMFAYLRVVNEAPEQAMRMLRVFERPLVEQRRLRPIGWSGQFAHMQDSRTADERWRSLQNAEQKSLYQQFKRNKEKYLSDEERVSYYKKTQYETTLGHYPEHRSGPYELQISVALAVFDPTRYENETITLMEEDARNATKRRRVARLLGVAGVDLPHRHIKLRLPYYKLGPGGSIFMIDHRGHVVLHDELRPVMSGIILKPNYKAVDLLDVEIPDDGRGPFNYSAELLQFREDLLMKENGTTYLNTLQIFDNRWRILSERRIYAWQRLPNTSYTVVVSLPEISLHSPSPSSDNLPKADTSLNHLLDDNYSIHPEWLYCRYINETFSTREDELKHFLQKMRDSKDFKPERLQRILSPLQNKPIEEPYMCNMELLRRLARDATELAWFQRDDTHGDELLLGTSTAFVATESGLTRWYHLKMDNKTAVRELGRHMPFGPGEAWYRRMWLAGPNKMVIASGGRGWVIAGRAIRGSAVAGFQITSEQLSAMLIDVTEPNIQNEDLVPRDDCSSDDWRCLIIDGNGWIIAGAGADADFIIGSQEAVHLAALHPMAMKLLIEAEIFEAKTVVDYQAACFRPSKNRGEETTATASLSLRNFVMQLVNFLWTFFFEMALDSIYHASVAMAAHSRIFNKGKALERKLTLAELQLLVNRTTLEGCARTSTLWSLRTDLYSIAQRRRPLDLEGCKWPLILKEIRGVDALFLAFFAACPDNEPKELFHRPEVLIDGQPPACIPRLPIRPGAVAYFQHEKEYRKCNETFIPDEKKSEAAILKSKFVQITIITLIYLF